MTNFKKLYNFKIILIIASTLLLYTNAGYALRLEIGEGDDTYPRIKRTYGEIEEGKPKNALIKDIIHKIGILEKDKKANKHEIAKLLSGIKRAGKPLFNDSQVNAILVKKNISERLDILLYLFDKKIVKDKKRVYQFNGYHISQIIISPKNLDDVKDSIEYLKGENITDAYHISRIIRSPKNLIDVKKIVKYLNGEDIINGSHISQIIRSPENLADVKKIIKYLKQGLSFPEIEEALNIGKDDRNEFNDLMSLLERILTPSNRRKIDGAV